jgi:protein phosphatase
MGDRPRSVGYGTDRGKVRDANEDVCSFTTLPGGLMLFVVADGMGGHHSGERAASLAVSSIVQEVRISGIEWHDPRQVRGLLGHALVRANREVNKEGTRGGTVRNMGTTALAMLVSGTTAHLAHVGDSRAYLVRGKMVVRLTKDHTQVQNLVDLGQLSRAQAKAHPEGHLLVRAIGISPAVEVDMPPEPLWVQSGDAILLCTDGLYSVVSGDEMAEAVARFRPQEACDRLIKLALSRGGPDNITVMIYRRYEPPTMGERLGVFFRRPVGPVPLYVWLAAFLLLCLSGVFLGLAFRSLFAPRPELLEPGAEAVRLLLPGPPSS